jgi:hypothetical protein
MRQERRDKREERREKRKGAKDKRIERGKNKMANREQRKEERGRRKEKSKGNREGNRKVKETGERLEMITLTHLLQGFCRHHPHGGTIWTQLLLRHQLSHCRNRRYCRSQSCGCTAGSMTNMARSVVVVVVVVAVVVHLFLAQ